MKDSDEYRALQTRLDEQAADLATAQSDLKTEQSDLKTAESDLDTAQSNLKQREASLLEAGAALAEAETSLSDAQARANEAEGALGAEPNASWPDHLKELFVSGCAEEPVEGLTDEQNDALCECIVVELERTVPLVDFLVFSLAILEPDVEVNPLTDLPRGMDEGFVETLAFAGAKCASQL